MTGVWFKRREKYVKYTKRGRRRASAFRHQVRLTVKEVISLRTLSLSLSLLCWLQTFERERKKEWTPFIASPFHVFSLPRSLLLPPSGKDMHSPEISVILYTSSSPHWRKEAKNIAQQSTHTQEKEKDKILQWPAPVSFFLGGTFSLAELFGFSCFFFLAGCRTSFYDRNFSLSPSSPLRLGSVIPAASLE